MPKSVLTRKRSLIARIAVLAMIFSLMAVALPASATSVAIDTSGPCPTATPSAGFTDIGAFDATTQTAINCLFAFGITTGTSATTYSPNDTITRWQMALFLIRQAADHGIVIPAPINQGYDDISALPAATQDAINQITQLEISQGTSSNTFSPNDGVTRWQMALFIYRTGQAAGVAFSNTPGHNDFVDIATLSAEAQTAISALSDTEPDPNGHIALGTGLSLFSPNLVLVRWQMALFLTRLLAADDVVAPAGIRVTVTPTDAVTLGALNGRAYTATFKNLDGTPYTGAVGITIKASVAGVTQYDDGPANTSVLENVSDGLIISGVPADTATGFPGTNGIVTFVVRHAGATETVVPVAWEDLNGNGLPQITGNSAPTEPFGLGGLTTFSAPLAEAAAGAFSVLVAGTSAATDSFTSAAATYNYDANDLFLIGGVPSNLADFEAALNAGDTVGGVYAPATGDQSTLDITNDVDPALTVTDPVAAGVTVDAANYAIKGTGVVGYTVAIYSDVDNLLTINPPDAKVGESTVAADGTWSVTVPLSQGVANNFTANQRALPADANGPLVNVPTITEGANTAALISGTTSANGGVAGSLDVGDLITVNFSEDVLAPNAGDMFDALETGGGGTSVRLTCNTNAVCTALDADTITLLVSGPPTILNAGDNGVLNGTGIIQALSGFTGIDAQAVNVVASTAGNRTFTPV